MLMIIKQEKASQLYHKSNERNFQSARVNSLPTEPSSATSRYTAAETMVKRFKVIFMNQAIQITLGSLTHPLSECIKSILRALEAQYDDIAAYLIGLQLNPIPLVNLADADDNAFYELKLGPKNLTCEQREAQGRGLFISEDGVNGDIQFKQNLQGWRNEIQEAIIKERVLVLDESPNLMIHQLRFERKKGFKRSYKCPYYGCNKCFSESGNLRTHLRTHTNSRPFKCDQCDKQFITKCHLTSHMLTHTGDRPFVCPYEGCGKNYPRSGRLKIHMRSHTGEKPYKCPYQGCKKSFTERGNLKTHMRIHENNKPHICSKCDKRFITNAHLKDHMSTHSQKKPFICQICKKFYKRISTLNVHLKQIHGVDPKDYNEEYEEDCEINDAEEESGRESDSQEENQINEEEGRNRKAIKKKPKRIQKLSIKIAKREGRAMKESNINSIKIPFQLQEEQKLPTEDKKFEQMRPLLTPAQQRLIEYRRASFVSCPQIMGVQPFSRTQPIQKVESPEEQRRRQSVQNPMLLQSQLDLFKDITPAPNFDHLFTSILTPQSRDNKFHEHSTPIYKYPVMQQPSPIQQNPHNIDFLKMVFQGVNSVQNSPFSTLQSNFQQNSPNFLPIMNQPSNTSKGKAGEAPQSNAHSFLHGGDSTYQALKFPGISPLSGNIGCQGSLNFSTAFSSVKCIPPTKSMTETPIHGRLPFIAPQNAFPSFPWLNTPQSRSVMMRKDSMTPGGAFSIPTGNLFPNVQSFEEAASMNEQGKVKMPNDINSSPKKSFFSQKRN